MNVNAEIRELEKITKLPTYEDVLPDNISPTAFIIFSYQDIQPAMKGDNKTLADTAYLQISLYTPVKVNYHSYVDLILPYLESIGYVTTEGMSYIDEYSSKSNTVSKIRHTVFEVEITKWRAKK